VLPRLRDMSLYAALAALPGAGAALRLRGDVVNYDILSDSWVLPLELTQTSSRWDMVVPFACAQPDCQRVAFFEDPNPYMPCGAVVERVALAHTRWHHARAAQDACAHDLATCDGAAGDWLGVRPQLSLYVRADDEHLRPCTLDGAMRVRLLFLSHLDETNSSCQAQSFDLAFRLHIYIYVCVYIYIYVHISLYMYVCGHL